MKKILKKEIRRQRVNQYDRKKINATKQGKVLKHSRSLFGACSIRNCSKVHGAVYWYRSGCPIKPYGLIGFCEIHQIELRSLKHSYDQLIKNTNFSESMLTSFSEIIQRYSFGTIVEDVCRRDSETVVSKMNYPDNSDKIRKKKSIKVMNWAKLNYNRPIFLEKPFVKL